MSSKVYARKLSMIQFNEWIIWSGNRTDLFPFLSQTCTFTANYATHFLHFPLNVPFAYLITHFQTSRAHTHCWQFAPSNKFPARYLPNLSTHMLTFLCRAEQQTPYKGSSKFSHAQSNWLAFAPNQKKLSARNLPNLAANALTVDVSRA